MPTPKSNSFTEFTFTQEELFAATRFSTLQLMLIQTLASRAAQDRLEIMYDPVNPVKFAQQEAESKGEIGAYNNLLMLYNNTEAPVAAAAKAEVNFQIINRPQKT